MYRCNGDLYLCHEAADAFWGLAQQLDNESIDIVSDGRIYALVVNTAFACELFLKTLSIKLTPDNSFLKTHKLGDLVLDLDQVVQDQIRNEYNKQPHKNSLDGMLNEFNEAFIDWRYSMEKGVGGTITDLLSFARVLSSLCK
ncbi:MAG: hypothetical protein J5685_01885 [Clostridiales bacterium]|nr:hypothetical protein [Clostridiales bacterium]